MAKDIQLDENIIKKNKIPLLIKDKEWINLFKEYITKDIKKLMDNLEELVEEEKSCSKELIISRKMKKSVMDMILKLSDDANTNDNKIALKQLEEAKNKLLEINDKIDELQYKLETIPKEIEMANYELLKSTVDISYNYIKNEKKRVNYLDEEIQKIRRQLGSMWEEKFTKEKRLNDLYLYLHGTLGHEETDKLDKFYL